MGFIFNYVINSLMLAMMEFNQQRSSGKRHPIARFHASSPMTTMSARQRAISRIFMRYPMASNGKQWIFCISTNYWQIAIKRAERGNKPRSSLPLFWKK
jgi:hypothetical protein